MKETGLGKFPFEDSLKGGDDPEIIKAKNALELGHPAEPVKDLPFKKEADRLPTKEEAVALEKALDDAAEHGEALSRKNKIEELRANVESIGRAIVEATTKGQEGAAWLEERYGGKDKAALEMLKSELELTTLKMTENHERHSKEKDARRKAEFQKKQTELTVKSAEIKEEIADVKKKIEETRAQRDRDDIDRIRRSLPRKG